MEREGKVRKDIKEELSGGLVDAEGAGGKRKEEKEL